MFDSWHNFIIVSNKRSFTSHETFARALSQLPDQFGGKWPHNTTPITTTATQPSRATAA